MSEIEPPKKPRARDTFRSNGECVATGYICEPGHDCRSCNVPIAVGQIQICNRIAEVRDALNIVKEEHRECECNDNEETGTESTEQ